MLPYVASLLVGYLAGSFPTAFLLVRWKSRVDIRTAGSGNVGAMNTFDVTNSKALGIAVFMIDALKGTAAVLLARALFGMDLWISGISGCGALLGHNYSVWLKFKGGRGLSTGVGVLLAVWWIVVPLWCVVWVLHYLISKNIHYANITASLVAPVALYVLPAGWIAPTLRAGASIEDARAITSVLCLLILLKHAEFIRQLFKSQSI